MGVRGLLQFLRKKPAIITPFADGGWGFIQGKTVAVDTPIFRPPRRKCRRRERIGIFREDDCKMSCQRIRTRVRIRRYATPCAQGARTRSARASMHPFCKKTFRARLQHSKIIFLSARVPCGTRIWRRRTEMRATVCQRKRGYCFKRRFGFVGVRCTANGVSVRDPVRVLHRPRTLPCRTQLNISSIRGFLCAVWKRLHRPRAESGARTSTAPDSNPWKYCPYYRDTVSV
jgi:hypothetical protein